ncbi:PEP-CTERM sorting domain-containing protein [Isosphaeraceae bacterium EP7]
MAHHQPQQQAARLSFTVREVHLRRGDRELIAFDHKSLVGQLVQAKSFASSNGGDLPHTALLDAAARVYKADPQLFTALHQCRALIRLLRGDLAHDSETLEVPIAQVPPTVAPQLSGLTDKPPTRPITIQGQPDEPVNPISTQAVPEPAALVMLTLGLAMAFLFVKGARKRPVQPQSALS